MATLTPVTAPEQIARLCDMADRIWAEHYTPILGAEQVSYMVEKFQSIPAVTQQIAEGYQYYLVEEGDIPAGYVGIVPEGNRLFLSKLYIDAPYRGKGLARQAIAFLQDYCRRHGHSSIYLTVNRHNTGSIAAYHAMGFVTTHSQVADIGSGYVMDDYVMTLSLPR